MANVVDNITYVNKDTVILDDTLGAYLVSTISETDYDALKNKYYDFGCWTDTLGLLYDTDTGVSDSDTGYVTIVEDELSESEKQLKELNEIADEELRRLSKAINDNYYVIPDIYKITITMDEKEDEVFVESDNLKFNVLISIGRANLKLSGEKDIVKNRLHDIINGAILFAIGNIQIKE